MRKFSRSLMLSLILALQLMPVLSMHRVQAQLEGCLPGFCGPPHTGCDPFWNNVVLLESYAGPVGAVTGVPLGIIDESPAAHGIPNTTVATNMSFTGATSVLGYPTSMNSTGGGSRLIFGDSNDWNLSNRLWTMELWINPASTSFGFIVNQWSNFAGNLGWVMTSDTTFGLSISTTGSNVIAQLASGAVFSPSTWYPVAMDFDGTTYRAYVNGSIVAISTSLHTFFNSGVDLFIGSGELGANSYVGNMQEIRITEDVARYHGAYTPTTIPFPRFGC